MNEADRSREAALKRLEAKRRFRLHATVYALVNLLLIIIWASTGAGYFWPIWSLAGWGIGLAIHGWKDFFVRPFSEEDIRREIEKGV